MRTAIVTTCYLDTPEYLHKTIKFCNYYSNVIHNFGADKIILMDNNSSREKQELLWYNSNPNIVPGAYGFKTHIPRKSHLEYGYLWRAVYHFQNIFNSGDFDKIVYMDNDFYVLSEELVKYIKDIDSGWTSLYCHKHNFPETGIQIVSRYSKEYQARV